MAAPTATTGRLPIDRGTTRSPPGRAHRLLVAMAVRNGRGVRAGRGVLTHGPHHGPLPARTVRSPALGIAEALEGMHACGIVHRDPRRLVVGPQGLPRRRGCRPVTWRARSVTAWNRIRTDCPPPVGFAHSRHGARSGCPLGRGGTEVPRPPQQVMRDRSADAAGRARAAVVPPPVDQTWSPVAFTSSTLRTLISMRFTSSRLDDLPRPMVRPGGLVPAGLRSSS